MENIDQIRVREGVSIYIDDRNMTVMEMCAYKNMYKLLNILRIMNIGFLTIKKEN